MIRDNQQQDDEDEGPGGMDHGNNFEPTGFEGPGGALVEEAKKLMQDDDGETPSAPVENSGPKIKMNRIGRKGKKPAAGGAGEAKKATGVAAGLEDFKPQTK